MSKILIWKLIFGGFNVCIELWNDILPGSCSNGRYRYPHRSKVSLVLLRWDIHLSPRNTLPVFYSELTNNLLPPRTMYPNRWKGSFGGQHVLPWSYLTMLLLVLITQVLQGIISGMGGRAMQLGPWQAIKMAKMNKNLVCIFSKGHNLTGLWSTNLLKQRRGRMLLRDVQIAWVDTCWL